MATTISFPKPYLAEGKIHIPASAYLEEYKAKVRELRRELVMPGFRPGQVPTDVIMGRYGERFLSEILSQKFLDSLKALLGDRELFQYPFYEHTPANYQVKPPFPDYEYTFQALVIAQEPLIREAPRLLRYKYEESSEDVPLFQSYLRMVFGRLEEVERLPEQLPADKYVVLRLSWRPYEGAEALRLRWNSFIEPFPWSHLAGRQVGETFEAPPHLLSAYTEYIRSFYPDFSPLTSDSVKLTITGAAFAVPAPLEEIEEKLHIHSPEGEAPHDHGEFWRAILLRHVEQSLSELNHRLYQNQFLQAAGIEIPPNLAQFLYLLYLSTRSRENARGLDYKDFQRELAWELLFQSFLAVEPSLRVSDEELKDSVWENIQKVGELSEQSKSFVDSLKESEAAREEFISRFLQNNEGKFRRSLQEKRFEAFLREKYGEPMEQPISLKSLLLYTL